MTQHCSLQTVRCCTADMRPHFLIYHKILSRPQLQANGLIPDLGGLKATGMEMRPSFGCRDRYREQYLLLPYSIGAGSSRLGRYHRTTTCTSSSANVVLLASSTSVVNLPLLILVTSSYEKARGCSAIPPIQYADVNIYTEFSSILHKTELSLAPVPSGTPDQQRSIQFCSQVGLCHMFLLLST